VLIAGEKTGRKVYGLELSEAFCDVVVKRWREFTDKAAMLDGDGRSFDEIAAERVAGARDTTNDAAAA